jgi:hypothetical protein
MTTIKLSSIDIRIFPQSSTPVATAAQLMLDWFFQKTGLEISSQTVDSEGESIDEERFHILIGTLDQPAMCALVDEWGLPLKIRLDGYVMALRENHLLIYSQVPRGVVYACGYEWPRLATMQGDELELDFDVILREPQDALRGWNGSADCLDFWPQAAAKYRGNLAWMDAPITGEALLSAMPELQPYLDPHLQEIRQRQAETDKGVTLARSYGLETFGGGLSDNAGLWHLPDYIYDGLIQMHPETIATSFQAGSEWPPFEWQDRSQLCYCSPATRQLFSAIVDDFMEAHPNLDGLCLSLGYDLYPFGCGCELCRDMSYHDRFRDQVQLVYDVVVSKFHKKLWLWTWVTGGSSAIPGYDHYYGWVKDFAQANPENVILTSFATEGDFNLTHRPNPVIGRRGPKDLGAVLLWPEYRGDGVVPSWLVDWMANALPALRAQGASGFMGVDTRPEKRVKDVVQAGEYYALSEFSWYPEKSAEQVAIEYCREVFGEQAAPLVAAALRKSGEVIGNMLYLPTGQRFSGHSHIENDLRIMWDVYTLYDSAPFFLSEEQRQQIIQSGPPYFPKIEAASSGLALTDENIAAILHAKDQAVLEAGWMLAQIDQARSFLEPANYEQLHSRIDWLVNYARLFRGLAHAFFFLRRGQIADASQVRSGAEEMATALDLLPQTGLPLPYDIFGHFGNYPWMINPPHALIQDLLATGELMAAGIARHPVGILGCEEAAAALDSLYIPYQRCTGFEDDLDHFSVIVVGSGFTANLLKDGDKLAAYIKSGGGVLLYNPTENWEALPLAWLPGKVQVWMCNHPAVRVTQPAHPIVYGYQDLSAQPIKRFEATSAGARGVLRHAPFIKSFVAVSDDWRTLTFPPVLAETAWGQGRLVIDLIPENRTILLRSLAYLAN